MNPQIPHTMLLAAVVASFRFDNATDRVRPPVLGLEVSAHEYLCDDSLQRREQTHEYQCRSDHRQRRLHEVLVQLTCREFVEHRHAERNQTSQEAEEAKATEHVDRLGGIRQEEL